MRDINRRGFLQGAMACAAVPAWAERAQPFLAGLVLGSGGPPRSDAPPEVARLESFWKACDDCSGLGVHYTEFNNTNRPIMEAYESRVSEFRDEMARRNLTLLGLAVYCHLHRTAELAEMVQYHLRVARFLQAVGGRYMAQVLAPGDNLGRAPDESYQNMDVRAAVASANEIGKRVREATGIRIGYHPESNDIRMRIYDRLLDSTDPRYYSFMPDVGHIAACGVDPMDVYKKYRSRMVGTHLRDFAPASDAGTGGQPGRGGMVPFGTGTTKLPALLDYLRTTEFTGVVMGEGGGMQAMRDYMAGTAKIQF
jgi:sugar phosphate isomerase/epimerase